MTTFLLFGAGYLLLAITLLCMLLRSPRGYEDERGFHHGADQPESDSTDATKVSARD